MSVQDLDRGGGSARVGYRLVLPPGWLRVPVRDDPQAVIEDVLERTYRRLPHGEARDRYPAHRARIVREFMAMVERAREQQGIDLYLPVEQVHGAVLPASFVVGLMEFDTLEVPPVEDVLVHLLAATDGARPAEVDGAPAVRSECRVPPVPGAEDASGVGSRRVDYVIGVPGTRDTWLAVTFSVAQGVAEDGSVVDPEVLAADRGPISVSDVLVDLFDAVMTTWRWVVG